MESLEETIESLNLPESHPEDRPERLQFKPGEEVFVRNKNGKIEGGWEFIGIDSSGSARVQRPEKLSGVPTGDTEPAVVPLDQLKKDFFEGFRKKEEHEALASHVGDLLKEREETNRKPH